MLYLNDEFTCIVFKNGFRMPEKDKVYYSQTNRSKIILLYLNQGDVAVFGRLIVHAAIRSLF